MRIGDKLIPSKGGTFYIDFRDVNGKRRQLTVGKTPTEAMDAWKLRVGVKAGDISPEYLPPQETAREQDKRKTIDQAIADYLIDVEATKGANTLKQYLQDLKWFRTPLYQWRRGMLTLACWLTRPAANSFLTGMTLTMKLATPRSLGLSTTR